MLGHRARSRPPLARPANSHGQPSDSLTTAADPARPTASTASANPDPLGSKGDASGSSAYNKRVNHTRISSARTENRRSHPRTVEAGRATDTAIGR